MACRTQTAAKDGPELTALITFSSTQCESSLHVIQGDKQGHSKLFKSSDSFVSSAVGLLLLSYVGSLNIVAVFSSTLNLTTLSLEIDCRRDFSHVDK